MPRPPPATTCPVENSQAPRSLSTLRPPHSVLPANLPWPCVRSLPLLSITEGDSVATRLEAWGSGWLGLDLRDSPSGPGAGLCLSSPRSQAEGRRGPGALPPLSLQLRALRRSRRPQARAACLVCVQLQAVAHSDPFSAESPRAGAPGPLAWGLHSLCACPLTGALGPGLPCTRGHADPLPAGCPHLWDTAPSPRGSGSCPSPRAAPSPGEEQFAVSVLAPTGGPAQGHPCQPLWSGPSNPCAEGQCHRLPRAGGAGPRWPRWAQRHPTALSILQPGPGPEPLQRLWRAGPPTPRVSARDSSRDPRAPQSHGRCAFLHFPR